MRFQGRLKAEEGGVCGPVVEGDTSFKGLQWGEDEVALLGVLARQV